MRATTHTELYRPFRGQLGSTLLQPLVFLRSGVRRAARTKWPLLLFVIPTIQTIVTAFIVNTAFAVKNNEVGIEMDARARLMAAAASNMFTQVEQQIVQLLATTQFFSMLVIAWYGSGLIADDRRLKAHLLYFSRPVTRWSYIVGKLAVVGFWGALAIVLPSTIILLVATFASPEWSFLTERWYTIVGVEAFALLWVIVHGVGILAISSLVQKRNHALVIAVGLFVLTNAIGGILSETLRVEAWQMLSTARNFDAIAEAWLGVSRGADGWPVGASYALVLGVLVVAFLVLARQVGRMEREA